MSKSKFDECVEKANKIHNNKYKYIQLFTKNKYLHLQINCELHGDFDKKISNHIIKKQGCPMCSKPYKLTTELFISKAKEIHGDKYDYSAVNYDVGKNKIQIICKNHGLFEQLPQNHLKGYNCPECAGTLVKRETFIKRAKEIHRDKYDYSNIEFIDMLKPINILCNIHGIFQQIPTNHLHSNGCYKCSGITRNTEDFVNKCKIIHNNVFDYSKVNYENTRKQVIIICKNHGEFKQTPNDHLSGYGCIRCGKGNYSKVCIKWLNDIMNNDNIFIQHMGNIGEKVIMINDKKYKVDGFCETSNTIYEFYGDIWHGNPNRFNKETLNPLCKIRYGELYENTIKRENELKNAGYNIITIWENDYKRNVSFKKNI
jgi:hypothetical protein